MVIELGFIFGKTALTRRPVQPALLSFTIGLTHPTASTIAAATIARIKQVLCVDRAGRVAGQARSPRYRQPGLCRCG